MGTKSAKRETFPIDIKQGSCVVKIYREIKRSGTYYQLAYYLGGKRCKEHFSDLEAAKTAADAKAKQLARGDVDAAQLTGTDRLVYGRALDALKPLGVALDAAAVEYAEAKKELDGFPLREAARLYMRHHGHGIRPKLVTDAVAEMIAAKTEKGVSPTYLADLRYRLGALAASEKNAGLVWQHSKAWFFESQRATVRSINKNREDQKSKLPPFQWKANALRHSFISYRLAKTQDVNKVALEAGNSPKMIFKHYRELCTPKEARTWFALAPTEPPT